MGALDNVERAVGILASIVWMVALTLNLLHARGAIGPVPGVTLPSLDFITDFATWIINTAYRIYFYVIIFTIIVLGIEGTIGLVGNFIGKFLPISIPGKSTDNLIKSFIAVLFVKAMVDGLLKYFGWTPKMTVEYLAMDIGSLTFISSALLGVFIGLALYEIYLKRYGRVFEI